MLSHIYPPVLGPFCIEKVQEDYIGDKMTLYYIILLF